MLGNERGNAGEEVRVAGACFVGRDDDGYVWGGGKNGGERTGEGPGGIVGDVEEWLGGVSLERGQRVWGNGERKGRDGEEERRTPKPVTRTFTSSGADMVPCGSCQ